MPSGLNRRSSRLDWLLQGAGSLKTSKVACTWIEALIEAIVKLREENRQLRRELRGWKEEA